MPNILYSFRRCPYAMRARMALASAGCDAEIREVVLKDKPASMLAMSEKGTVPVLMIGKGGVPGGGLAEKGTVREGTVPRVLDESLDIMDWALAQRDPDNWLRNRKCPRRTGLLETNDGSFKQALDRYKYPNRYPDADPEAAHSQAVEGLGALEQELQDKNYLDGDTLGFFDAAIFPFVRQFAAVEPDRFAGLPYPRLIGWHSRLLKHRAFTRIMKKLSPWRPTDAPLSFQETVS